DDGPDDSGCPGESWRDDAAGSALRRNMKNGLPHFASGLHRRVFAILLATFALYWPPHSFARADAIDDFRTQYPAAEAKLREAYGQVQMTGRHLRYARPGVVSGNILIQ